MGEKGLVEVFQPVEITIDGLSNCFVINDVLRCTLWAWQPVVGIDEPQKVIVAHLAVSASQVPRCIDKLHNAATFNEIVRQERAALSH